MAEQLFSPEYQGLGPIGIERDPAELGVFREREDVLGQIFDKKEAGEELTSTEKQILDQHFESLGHGMGE
jgi:hypothetical protein